MAGPQGAPILTREIGVTSERGGQQGPGTGARLAAPVEEKFEQKAGGIISLAEQEGQSVSERGW